jgi:hypothetical protein
MYCRFHKINSIFSKKIYVIKYGVLFSMLAGYLIDVLWGQPIKLIQVVSTSEFHEY